MCTWTTVTFDKTHGKFTVGLMSEYRHIVILPSRTHFWYIIKAYNVLRTGIELYMIISKLRCLQADLQAAKDDFL